MAPNPPAGGHTDRVFTTAELNELFVGAELLRYAEGDDEHAGNVMAVFRTPEGHGFGLTFCETSTTPESIIGETVRRIKIGSGLTHGKAFVLFEDVDPATEKIIVRNTAALGVHEVALDDPHPEL